MQADVARVLQDLNIAVSLQSILSVSVTQNAGKYEQDTITEVIKLKQLLS